MSNFLSEMRVRLGCVLPLAVLGLAVAGCGSSDMPEVVPVSGVVTCNGKPVPNLFLNFLPEKGRPSWAVTDMEGKYVLDYDGTTKGAVVGKHTVWVNDPPSGAEGMGPQDQPKKSADLKAILAKYGDMKQPQINIEVKSGTTTYDLKLD